MEETTVALAPLPSKGKIYTHDSLKNKDTLSIRPMRVKELNMFSSQAYLRQGIVIDKVVESCLIDKNVPIKDLITADKEMLMIMIRIVSYGKDFSQEEVKCPECNAIHPTYKFDLGAIKYDALEVMPLRENSNCFSFKLPVSGKDVEFKFLTSEDEREIEAIQEVKVKKNFEETEITERLNRHILSIGGKSDRAYIYKYIDEEMSVSDARELLEYIEKSRPSVKSLLPFKCEKCKITSEIYVPIARSFFLHK